MRYHIKLTISYDYDGQAASARHLLRLMPATIPGVQRLVMGRIGVTPTPDEQHSGQDFFGNTVHGLVYRRAHDALVIALEAHVQRFPVEALLMPSVRLGDLASELAHIRDLGPHAPLHCLGPSPRVAFDEVFRTFAEANMHPGMTVLEVAEALNLALHRHMTFDAEATDVDTTPRTAFRLRRGVCQDYVHILIACLRMVGIPAGYVSGFLRTLPPPGKDRLAGADAMHAWARVWCGMDIGWREFDPTNAILAGLDHIVVAYGRDYSDIAPVKGVARLTGGHAGRHEVDVIPVSPDAG